MYVCMYVYASPARRRTRPRNIPLAMQNDGRGSMSMELGERALELRYNQIFEKFKKIIIKDITDVCKLFMTLVLATKFEL